MKFYIDSIVNVKEAHEKLFFLMMQNQDYDDMAKYLEIKYHNGLGKGCIAIPENYVDIIDIKNNIFDEAIDFERFQ